MVKKVRLNRHTNIRNLPSKSKAQIESLVLENRKSAFRFGCSITRKVGYFMDKEELQSLCDVALCQAAARYLPKPGASFTSYLYFFVKGEIIHALRQRIQRQNQEVFSGILSDYEDQASSELKALCYANTPEDEAIRVEFRNICHHAILSLSTTERLVIMRAHCLGYSMVNIAKEMGYSRGHLFSMRKNAEAKLRQKLTELDFKKAA